MTEDVREMEMLAGKARLLSCKCQGVLRFGLEITVGSHLIGWLKPKI